MKRTLLDDDLRAWEAYSSGGKFGLAADAKIVFHCLSDPAERARSVETEMEEDDAAARLRSVDEAGLREMFLRAEPLP